MKNRHPLMVLSPREFNERTGIVIGLPMTTAAYDETNPFVVRIMYIMSKTRSAYRERAP